MFQFFFFRDEATLSEIFKKKALMLQININIIMNIQKNGDTDLLK